MEQWELLFREAGIPALETQTYVKTFIDNRIIETALPDLSKEYFTDLGFSGIGHILGMIRYCKALSTERSTAVTSEQALLSSHAASSTTSLSQPADVLTKLSPIKLPHASTSIINQGFRKFKIDWGVFKSITTIPPIQVAVQLYNLCDEPFQNSIINVSHISLTLNEAEMLHTI